jgi:hypothetical protein
MTLNHLNWINSIHRFEKIVNHLFKLLSITQSKIEIHKKLGNIIALKVAKKT